jgi:hypothetical protein
MRSLSLTTSQNATLDSSGNGTVQAGPASPGEVWYPTSVSISSTGDQPSGDATCYVYAGETVAQWTFVDATYNVLGAASSLIAGKVLYPGQYVQAVFTGANPGATATLVVTGTRTVP